MLLTLLAYFKVLISSSRSDVVGLKQAIITVLLFPPNDVFKSRVSLLSRYGTWILLRFESASAQITLPRASSPVLMETDSLKRVPRLPVRCALSEPAKSTKWKTDVKQRPIK